MGLLDAPPTPSASIGQRLRLAAAAAYRRNGPELGVAATPPAVTQSSVSAAALDASLNTSCRAIADSAAASFAFRGGVPTVFSSVYYRMPCVTVPSGGNITSTSSANAAAVEFYSDAAKIAIKTVGSTTNRGFMAEVDDQPIAASPLTYLSNTAEFFMLDFTGAGGTKPRRFRYEIDQAGGAFDGVFVAAADSVWAPPGGGIRAAVIGDSTVVQTGATLPNGGWTVQVGKMLGWSDVRSLGIGGWGWVTNGSNGNVHGSAQRVADAVTADPDVLIAITSQNDSGVSSATVTAAMLAGLRAYRAALPSVPIIVTGVNPSSTNGAAATVALEAAGKAAFDAWADGNSWWVPVSATTSTNRVKPWLHGSGYVGATNGSGNTDRLLSDSAHYSQAGHNYYARRVVDAIRELVLLSPRLH